MRKIIIIVALLCAGSLSIAGTFALIQIGRAAQAGEQAVTNNREALTATLANVEASSRAVAASAAALQASAEQQQKLLARPEVIRSITLLAQSGDDLNRGAKKLNHLLDIINRETLPRVGAVLDSSRAAIDSTNVAVSTLSQRGAAVADNLDGAVVELRVRLADPHLQRLIAGLADTSEEGAATLKELRLTESEIRAAIPELLGNINKLAGNGAQLTGEMAKFVEGINRPLSRKQKAMRAIIQILAIAAPVAVRR